MPKFNIPVNVQGAKRTATITADTYEAAVQAVRAKGYTVDDAAPADPLGELADAAQAPPTVIKPVSPALASVPPLPPPKRAKVPGYGGMTIMAFLLQLSGVVTWLIGFVLFQRIASLGANQDSAGLSVLSGFVVMVIAFLIGLVLLGFGQCLEALRDIARNSWKMLEK